MIKDLKKQLEEQKLQLQNELTEKLAQVFGKYELDVKIDDAIEAVSVIAKFTETPKEEPNKTNTTTVTILHNRKEGQNFISTMGTSLYVNQDGTPIGMGSYPLTLSFEVIAFVFNTLIQFINEKNPIEVKE